MGLFRPLSAKRIDGADHITFYYIDANVLLENTAQHILSREDIGDFTDIV